MKILFLLLMVGCASLPPDSDPKAIYMRSMPLDVNGAHGVGVMVAPKGSSYKIELRTKSSAEVLRVTTCHREMVYENIGKSFEFTYTPVGLEKTGGCPLEIGAFDLKGLHSWGLVDFVFDESMQATVNCNGSSARQVGVSVCQSRVGLIQEIVFSDAVKVSAAEGCEMPTTKDQMVFRYKTGRDKCLYVFYKDSKNIHKHTSLGYEAVILREQ